MSETKKITLPSGAILEIGHVPFSEAHNLQKAIAFELGKIPVESVSDLAVILKDGICAAIVSDRFNEALAVCFKRCLYNGNKITDEAFETEEARGDYFQLCFEVAMEISRPFGKGLYAKFGDMLQKVSTLK